MTTSLPDPGVALVVAHPDDEALWLSAALGQAGRIVLCFGAPFNRPPMAGARAGAVAALPLPGLIDLALPESGAGFLADWQAPVLTRYGIDIVEPAARRRYEANFATLLAGLRSKLAGCHTVFTHNPWGEYGHAEHVQVHRAVMALQTECGFTVRVSNYVGPRSWPLAMSLAAQPLWSERLAATPDVSKARRLMRIYRRHGAWTWSSWHRWPAAETMYTLPAPEDPAPRRAFAGERLLDATRLRWFSPHLSAARTLPDPPGSARSRRQDGGAGAP